MSDTPQRDTAYARWHLAPALALSSEAAHALNEAPVLVASYMDDEEDEAEPGYTVQDGVAIVSIEGALLDRALWFWDGYDAIQARAERAFDDPDVRKVLLDLDSPGGMVAGLFDCMRALRAKKRETGKPLCAWVSAGAFSAAYGLASTADEIVVADTAGVGSVGVIASLRSCAAQLAQDGIDMRVVASGEEKTDGHPAVAITKAAETRLRNRVEELAGMFFAEVGAGRANLTPVALRDLQGGVRYGRAAVAAGLADRIATRAQLLADLAAGPVAPAGSMSAPSNVFPRPMGAVPQDNAMSKTETTSTRGADTLATLRNMLTVGSDDELVAALSTLQKDAAKVPELSARLTTAEKALAERVEADRAAEHKAVLDKHFARGALTKADLADPEYMATLNALDPKAADKILSRRPGLPTAAVSIRKATAVDPEKVAAEPTVEDLSEQETELARAAGVKPEALIAAKKDEQRQRAATR